MAVTIKKNITVAVKKEVTENTYVAPSAGADFIQAQSDGIEMNGSKDTLTIDVIGLGLDNAKPRVGLESGTGSLGVYMKSGSTEGSAPEYGDLVESLLGAERSSAAQVSGTGHTSSLINVSSTADYVVGDIVVIKEAGAFHTSPIASIVANTSITLLIAGAGSFSDAVEVAAFQSYATADSGHPSLSVSKYVEGAILEKVTGCKSTSMSLESFTTGTNASLKFGFEGAEYTQSVTAQPVTASYDTSETPVILDACIWQDGAKIEINDFTLSVENSLGWVKDTCNGKQSSRVTNRTISGTINPYKQDDSVANFTKFDANGDFSLVITAHNPGSAGEYSESVSFYLPICVITEIAEGDIDGVLTENLSFSVNSDGVLESLIISMS